MNNSSISQAFYVPLERRKFLKALALAGAAWTLPGYLAEALTLAPRVTAGPFYPLPANVPLDDDNDLLYLGDKITVAAGLITYVGGRVLDSRGNPIKDALIEIWHADNDGEYIYSSEAKRNPRADVNFQGIGRFQTGATGQYMFRTIKAGLYQGRTRHCHVAMTAPGEKRRFCTQLFWNETARAADGQPWEIQNGNDMVLQGVRNAEQRRSILLDYAPVNVGAGAVSATWDFVLDLTPLEPEA